MHKYLILFFLLVLVHEVAADDTDLIGDTLDKAKTVYSETVDKAKTDLLTAFDSVTQDVAKSGNLDSVKNVLAEKKSFESDGKLPTSQLLKKAAADFKAVSDKSTKTMISAYEVAISSYTKALQIEKADEIKNELDEFKKQSFTTLAPAATSPPVNRITEKAKRTDNFVQGSVWIGAWIQLPNRGVGDFSIVVTERIGNTFKGELHSNQEGDLEYIAGEIDGDQIEWRFTKVVRTNRPELSRRGDIAKGTINGDCICVPFHNEPADGLPKQTGFILLKLVK